MISSFLAGFPGGLIQADRLNQERQSQQTLETLRQLALQKSQQQEQGEGLAAKFALNYDPSQAPQAPPMTPLGGGAPDLSSTLSGIGGLPPGISRDSSGHLTRNGQPPDTMLPGGIPAWKSGDGMVSGLPPQGAVPLPRFQDAIYGLETDRGRNVSTSSAGALGPMQVMPDTARQYGFTPEQAATSREPGNAIAADLYKRYGGNTDLAAIAYNAGPGRADAIQKGAPVSSLPPETQNYLTKLHRDLDMEVGQKGVAMIQKGAPVPAVQASTELAKQAGREIDPRQWGMAGLHQMMQAIDKLDPGAPDAVKWIALGQVNKLLAPEEKLRAQMYAREHQQELSLLMKDMQIAQSQAGLQERTRHDLELERLAGERAADSDTRGGSIIQAGDQFFRVPPKGEPVPLNLPAGSHKLGTGQTGNVSDMQAEWVANYIQATGTWPVGSGRNQALQNKVEQVLAAKGVDPTAIAQAQGSFKADQTSLAAATKLADATASYEQTALKNLDLATEQIHKAAPTDFGPFINKWIETGETFAGDTTVPKSVASVITLANEYAKVMSGSTGAQAATDSSRREAAQVLNPYFSSGQWDEVGGLIRREMDNRITSLRDNVDIIRSRMGRGGAATKPPGGPAEKAGAAPSPASGYSTAQSVWEAYQAGKLPREQAMKILEDQFGVKAQ